MIQRLQTVYLGLIIVICAILCTGSFINIHEDVNGTAWDYVMNMLYFMKYENRLLVESKIQYELIAIISLIIGWTLRVIFAYKNRQQQIKYARINFLFMLILLAASFSKALMYFPNLNFHYMSFSSAWGMALFLCMFYLNWRAIMMIKRDEALVKSADRIR